MPRLLTLALIAALFSATACKKKADWNEDDTKKGSGGSGAGVSASSDDDGPKLKKHPIPASGSALDSATALTVVGDHACAISDGKMLCWDPGQPAEQMSPPSAPFAISGPCALTDSGDLWCVAPKEMKVAANVTSGGQLTATSSDVCVGHRMDIKCWHIGDPDPYATFGWAGVDKIDLGDGKICSAVAGGVIECADLTTKEVKAAAIDGPEDTVEIAVGGSLICAATNEKHKGTVECWAGTGKRAKVPKVTAATDVAVGPTGDACAMVARGEVMCWKVDGGSGTIAEASVQQVGGIKGAQAIGVGAGFGCAIDGDSKVSCWGKASKEPQNAQMVSRK